MSDAAPQGEHRSSPASRRSAADSMVAELDEATLRATVLARQHLTTPADERTDVPALLRAIGTFQAQHTVTNYLGLRARLSGFRRRQLTDALMRRDVVLGTMFRETIHLCAADEYWRLVHSVRDSRRSWRLRQPDSPPEDECRRAADRLRAAFATQPVLTRAELDAVTSPVGFAATTWVDVVRVPPSGTWERRRADRFALADEWVGPEPPPADDNALDHAVRRVLTGFGPASAKSVAAFLQLTVAATRPALERVAERRFRFGARTTLYDLDGLPLALADTPQPVRFLGQIEAVHLVFTRPAQILREVDRPLLVKTTRPQGIPMFLVGGHVAGTWAMSADGVVEPAPWQPLERGAAAEVALAADELTDWLR